MKNRWDDQAAAQAIRRRGECYGTSLALRLYTADLIGQDPELVLHGGGNVSLKQPFRTRVGDEVEAIYVKGSGCDLAGIQPENLPALDLAYLRRLRSLDALDDAAMVNELRTHLFDATAPTPSIESLAHAFLPQRFIDHSHADAVLALTNQPDGERLIREAVGDTVAVLPYVTPGFELAQALAELYEADPTVEGIVLVHHGLLTFGDDARTAYERHIRIVDACEAFVASRAAGRRLTISYSAPAGPAELAALAAPILRGLIAVPTGNEDQPYVRSILQWDASEDVLDFVNSEDAKLLAQAGPLTTDHLIRTKAYPLYVNDPAWADAEALRAQLRTAVENYRQEYRAYAKEHSGSAEDVDPSPRVVLLPGAGVFCWGRGKRDARIAADITRHALATKAKALAIGTYTGLPAAQLYTMEFRAMQLAKLDRRPERPLERQVVVISGGAGAIGAAIAETCAQAGAHVVVTDLNEEGLKTVVRRIEEACGPGAAAAVVMDVTSEASVRAGYEELCRLYGGVDVVVPNAGIAHVAPLEELRVDDFRRVLEVNATGYLLFMREGMRVLRRQGLGGHIVINSSKNVFGPGKDFGAYSASKAAGHQLGKIAAIELAPYGIRVNMINADAVFAHAGIPSGLWAEVGPARARSRGMKPEDLPEYYRGRNLLKARVCGHHVGNAVVFFASNATPTTGATLPVDGGVPEAFPR
ncbi:MAG: bifunctional aldolase/short-chain dehydrogenase [Planctomycetes bacterium]|nr:bifunctional aldolase/short-chain dehydrogenase [Planctomycetota bacterium]